MKKTLIALATVACLGAFAGRSAADPGGYAPPAITGGGAQMSSLGGPGTLIGAGDLPPGRGPDMYGFHPSIKKLFHFGSRGKNCDTGAAGHGKNPLQNPANWAAGGYGVGGPAYNPQGFPPGAYGPNGPMMQGTLAFPHHTFVRSPRDYFMMDMNK